MHEGKEGGEEGSCQYERAQTNINGIRTSKTQNKKKVTIRNVAGRTGTALHVSHYFPSTIPNDILTSISDPWNPWIHGTFAQDGQGSLNRPSMFVGYILFLEKMAGGSCAVSCCALT